LLGNGSVNTSRRNEYATIEDVFSVWSDPKLYNEKPTITDSSFTSERMLHKDYYRKSTVGKKTSGLGPQGAWRQDELIGGKPPVIK
jgi:hypothetical protein